MGNISKAIAAGVGGAVAGGGASAVVLPTGTPWWGYLIMTLVTTVLPAIVTYAAPKNTN